MANDENFFQKSSKTKLTVQELAHKPAHYLGFKELFVVTAALLKSSRLCYKCGEEGGWLTFN